MGNRIALGIFLSLGHPEKARIIHVRGKVAHALSWPAMPAKLSKPFKPLGKSSSKRVTPLKVGELPDPWARRHF